MPLFAADLTSFSNRSYAPGSISTSGGSCFKAGAFRFDGLVLATLLVSLGVSAQ